MSKKYVYFFGGGKAEGSKEMKNLLGGKGANLHEMTNLGIPVPPGFTISTESCVHYFKTGRYPEGLKQQVEEAVKRLEELTGKKFGSTENPLLVSVRSGARVSMPGMMDTILNLGLNDDAVKGLAKRTGDERFAYDSYRRFIQMFSEIVMGIPHKVFEELLDKKKKEKGVNLDYELDADALKELVEEYKTKVRELTGKEFPQNPQEQLWMAIEAVFKSWNNKRAIEYRKLHRIPDDWGTAVNVQTMVFGNMGFDSATGVAFTRDPSTGEKILYGEYLPNAQGEDVVAGIRTPKPISELEKEMPEAYKQLVEIFDRLEKHYRDMMDLEFTIEKGKVYLLQTRVGKRSARAEVKIAVDMVKEGLITKEEAIMRVDPKRVEQLLHPMVDPKAPKNVIAKGLPASPGAASGKVIFDSEEAAELAEKGERIILVRDETSPEDIKGMARSKGILTSRGGMTSHAAVVARGIGTPCVVGAEEIEVDYGKEEFRVGDVTVKKGDVITIDGSTGEVMVGEVPTVDPEFFPEFSELLEWADEFRWIGVRANADTPMDAERARKFGAEGIGLARTEHMFFEGERIYAMQEMILAKTKEEREKALSKLLPMQREDFKGLFKAMDGFPVTIRLLDPPLHEFVPKTEEQIKELSERTGIPAEEIKAKAEALREANPMLGHRGCRLGITYPEITEMQVRAIFEAACEAKKEGVKVYPEIMVPLVSIKKEIEIQKEIIDRIAREVMEETGIEIEYSVGTMIELPRAALTADEIAEVAEFFSFGTNDLTQTTFGFSRDDVGKFVPKYIELGLLEDDPFQVLDQRGVGQLVKVGVEKGRGTRPDLKVGICGEHGGEPTSVKFCHRVGMDYVSCSPFRVPVARLSAAQAVIEQKFERKRKPH
ncbi:MAG: pyruvate, phosphate dikinase [Candidatus Hydrothermota bacterium]|nr:MAG: pyruvate, phosphate dikinase [Candidatus Hydrothermae bacterium]